MESIITTNSLAHAIDVFVGKRIAKRRKDLQLSLASLAKLMGISFQQLHKYELGLTRVSASTLYNLAKILGMKPGDFFVGCAGTDLGRGNGAGDSGSCGGNGNGSDNSSNKVSSNGNVSGSSCNINTSPSTKQSPQLHILIVSDDAKNALQLTKAIKESEIATECFVLHNTALAIEFLRKYRLYDVIPFPDLAILSLHSNDKDNLQFLQAIKNNAATQVLPVIIISHSNSVSYIRQLYKHFAAGVIRHTADLGLLKGQIEGVLRYWSGAVVLPIL